MKNFVRDKISTKARLKIRYTYRSFLAFFFQFNLSNLAKIHRTDKNGDHFYTKHYQDHFRKRKFKRNIIFEIGVGGYEDPFRGGNSLRMWKSYFPFSKIVSLDIYDKSFLNENRIKIFEGSQIDAILLENIAKKENGFDLIIDDGSHVNSHVINTFKILFPLLNIGGIYVIEDTQTSYWDDYGGDSNNLNNPNTIYGFFKTLIDGLNHEEIVATNYQKSYFDKTITSIHFYHNLIFIYKGKNEHKSNYIVNNQIPHD